MPLIMNRRASLSKLLGRKSSNAGAAATADLPGNNTTINSGLEPYVGPWEFEQAAHLLRRTMFGPTYAQMKEAVDLGLDGVIHQLFQELPLPEPPVNFGFEDDPNVPVGETWIDAPYSQSVNLFPYRFGSLGAWTM